MAAAAGDLIRITDRQTLLGQQVLNVYFYRVNDVTPLIGDYLEFFATEYLSKVLNPVALIQHDSLSHVELYLENLSNGIDIKTYAEGFPVSGQVASGDVMPPYVSWGFQLIRESRVTRNGYKRFGGVPEVMVTDGVFDGDPDLLEDIEEGLAADFTVSIVTFAAPVIVKHPFEVPAADYDYSDIGSAQYKAVGSQNTRKFGRGS